MEFIKEFLDEGRARIKSNVFASVVFAFVVLNWQPLFFVAFEKADSVSKFEYFDENTTSWELYLLPLIIGFALALGLPFINNFAHKVVSGAISATRMRDDEHAHQRLKKKNEWEEERVRGRKLYAEKLISEAQIDQEIDDKIQDPEKRDEIRAKIEDSNLSAELDGFKVGTIAELQKPTLRELRNQNLSKGAEVWLSRINKSPYSCINEVFDAEYENKYFFLGDETYYDDGKSQDFGILTSALIELLEFGLLKREEDTYSVTRLGESIAVEIDEIPF